MALKNLWEKVTGKGKEVEQSGDYNAEVGRKNPMTFVFMLDQSGSMDEEYVQGESKAKAVAFAVNQTLRDLIELNLEGTEVYDRFQVAVIGYREPAHGQYEIGSVLGGELAGKILVPLSELFANPLRLEKDEDGEEVEIWVDPVSSGGTPMCAAYKYVAEEVLVKVAKDNPEAFPAITLNFTDADATDGDIVKASENIKSLKVDNGNFLLFSCHLPTGGGTAQQAGSEELSAEEAGTIAFPDSEGVIPDKYGRLLFQASSYMPVQFRDNAEKLGYTLTEKSKGFMFKARASDLFKFINIGSRTGTALR